MASPSAIITLGLGDPYGSPSDIITLGYGSGAFVASIAVTLTDANNDPIPSLSGLDWAWFDQLRPKDLAAPTDQGMGATTDASGVFSVTSLPNSTLTAGQQGRLIVADAAGNDVASGPVTVH